MVFRLVAVFALATFASAGYIGAPVSPVAYAPAVAAPVAYAAPVAKLAPAPLAYAAPIAKVATPAIAVAKTIDADYDPHPQYTYSYDVQDSLTGDNKEQEESRNGDNVQGRYSFIEADGTRRIVEYTADPVNGFNAVVRREPAQLAVKTVAPVAYAAPAPLAYAQPQLKVLH